MTTDSRLKILGLVVVGVDLHAIKAALEARLRRRARGRRTHDAGPQLLRSGHREMTKSDLYQRSRVERVSKTSCSERKENVAPCATAWVCHRPVRWTSGPRQR